MGRGFFLYGFVFLNGCSLGFAREVSYLQRDSGGVIKAVSFLLFYCSLCLLVCLFYRVREYFSCYFQGCSRS